MRSGPRHRPLPPGLRLKLRDIPRHEAVCRDVERLYRATRERAHGRENAPRDPAAERHLASCERCRELYDTLYSAFDAPRRKVPRPLARRLAAIARHPERLVPEWILDPRYAAAACYLAASLTLALAGDASAVFRHATESVSSKARVWIDESETKSLVAWDAVSSSVGEGFGRVGHEVTRYGASVERAFADTVRTIGATTRQLLPDRLRSVEGEDDGGTRDSDGTRHDGQ